MDAEDQDRTERSEVYGSLEGQMRAGGEEETPTQGNEK